MEISDAIDYARGHRQAVIATLKRDGRPQLSNVVYLVDAAGRIRISATGDRAKTANLRRDPRATVHITSEDFRRYCVIDADVAMTDEAASPDDATVDELVAWYREMAGEHPDWDDYRRAMVAERRLLLTLTPTHAYGMLAR